jgi:hypothetical protein
LDGYPLVNDENDSAGLTFISCVLKGMKRKDGIWKHIKKDEKDNQKSMVYVMKTFLLREQSIMQRIERKKLQIANGDVKKKETRDENLLDKWVHFMPPLEEQVSTEYLKPVSMEDVALLDARIGARELVEVVLRMESMIFRLSLIIQKQIQEIVSSSENELLKKNYIGQNYISNNCCQTILGPNSRVFDLLNDESKNVIQYNNTIAFDLSTRIINAVQFSEATLLCSMFDTRNSFPALIEGFSEQTMNIAFIYYLKYKTGEKIQISGLDEFCNQRIQEKDFSKMSYTEIIEELKKDDVSFKNCFNVENFNKLLLAVSKTKIVPTFTSDDCMESTELIFIKQKEETHAEDEADSTSDFLLKMLKKPGETEAEQDRILLKNQQNVVKIMKFLGTQREWYFFVKRNISRPNPLESTTTPSSSFYVKVNFFKTMISNMVYLYPNQIIHRVKNNDLELPPGIVKITDKDKTALKNIMLEERNDSIFLFKHDAVKSIVRKVQQSRTCRFLEELSRNLPVFNQEVTEILYDFITNEILVSYVNFCEDVVKEVINKKEAITLQVQELLERYITMLTQFGKNREDSTRGINLSYQEINEIWFNAGEKEKNKILEKLKKMTDEEREAYNDTKKLKGKQAVKN